MQKISHETAIKAFQKFGFNIDLRDLNVTVLREVEFPFRRLTLPNQSLVTTDLLHVYLEDLHIDNARFFRVLQQIAAEALPPTNNQ